jgi:hypothetical protein
MPDQLLSTLLRNASCPRYVGSPDVSTYGCGRTVRLPGPVFDRYWPYFICLAPTDGRARSLGLSERGEPQLAEMLKPGVSANDVKEDA